MSPQTATPPATLPFRRPSAQPHAAASDGAFYEDAIPPELFDEDEDREDLMTYIHIASTYND